MLDLRSVKLIEGARNSFWWGLGHLHSNSGALGPAEQTGHHDGEGG
jgi:hypothetical protein